MVVNIDKIHTTELSLKRVGKNLGLDEASVIAWCKQKIENADSILRKGKNYYVYVDDVIITINAHNYTIITARREKIKKGCLDGVNIIRKIDDIPELKKELISVFDEKSHKDVSRYALLLAEHVLNMTQTPYDSAIQECFDINRKWQEGKAKFQEARNVAFKMHRLAREEKDSIKVKVFRVLGQVAATPHVKRHALIASDYAIKLTNLLYPKDLEAVKRERETQIALMRICNEQK